VLERIGELIAAGTCFAAGGGHGDQFAGGCQFQHRIRIGLAHQLKLIGVKPQLPGQLQRLTSLSFENSNPRDTMAQLLIRQLDDQVVAALRARARAQGLPLEQSLRNLLSAAVQQDEALQAELARLRATTPAADRSLDVAALIREDRDGR
jgi:antitoxin FitA